MDDVRESMLESDDAKSSEDLKVYGRNVLNIIIEKNTFYLAFVSLT